MYRYLFEPSKLEDIEERYRTNKVFASDRAFHDWYRFVLSFPPHLVRHYIQEFDLDKGSIILDPFSGTGTTIIESKLRNFKGIGIEANPVVKFASQTKVNWEINPLELEDVALEIANRTKKVLLRQGIDDWSLTVKDVDKLLLKDVLPEKKKLLLKNSVSPLPLHKSLVLLEEIKSLKSQVKDHLTLAFITSLVKDISNLKFGPEVGLGIIKNDAKVIEPWLSMVYQISHDLKNELPAVYGAAEVILGDARNVNNLVQPGTIDAVITSPPYPNEKDYSRTTRLENVILGLINDIHQLRTVKKSFVRSNTRSVYKEDNDHKWIKDISIVHKLAEAIETKRIEMGKNSGFEKMYSKVTLQYFGGMARHLENLKNVLKPGAHLAYVVGDQASYLRVMIRTGQILCEIAEKQGYEVIGIDLFRTRFATRSKEELREEVVILKWNG